MERKYRRKFNGNHLGGTTANHGTRNNSVIKITSLAGHSTLLCEISQSIEPANKLFAAAENLRRIILTAESFQERLRGSHKG